MLPLKNKGKMKNFLIYLSFFLSGASLAGAQRSEDLVRPNDLNYAIGSGFNIETSAICRRTATFEGSSSTCIKLCVSLF